MTNAMINTSVLIYSLDTTPLVNALSLLECPIIAIDASQQDLSSAVQEHHPALVILDDLHDCETYHAQLNCPVLMVCPADMFEAALAAGADDYAPLHPTLLHKRVTCMLQSQTLAAYDTLPTMVHALDNNLTLRYVNAYWLEKLGYTRAEVLGKSIFDFMTASSQRLMRHKLKSMSPQERIQDLALVFLRKEGGSQHVLLNVEQTSEEQSISVLQDVNSLQVAQREARETQSELQSIVNALVDAILVMHRDGTYLQVVSQGAQSFPIDIETLVGHNMHDYIPAARADRLLHLFDQALITGDVQHLEYERPEQSEPSWRSVTVSPFTDDRVVVVMRDITAAKLTQQSLALSEARYRSLFENATDAILIIHAETQHIVNASPQAARLLGYSTQELVAMPIDAIDLQADGHLSQLNGDVAQTRRLITESQYRRYNGSIIDVEISSRFVLQGDDVMLLSFVRDITERKKALTEIQKQRELAQALLDITNRLHSFNTLDTVLDTVLAYVSRIIPVESANIMIIEDGTAKIIRQIGYEAQGFEPDDISAIEIKLSQASNLHWVYTHKRPKRVNDTVNDPDFAFLSETTENYVQSLITTPIITEGEVVGFVNVDGSEPQRFTQEHEDYLMAFTNQLALAMQRASMVEKLQMYTNRLEQLVRERTAEITRANADLKRQIIQRKLAESKLKAEQARLRILIDNLPDNIYVKDTEQRFVVVNQTLMQRLMADKKMDEVIGRTNHELFGDAPWVLETAAENAHVLKTGEPVLAREYNTQLSGNPATWILVTKIPLRDAEGTIIGFVGINRDISDIKRAQEQLSHERMQLKAILDAIKDGVVYTDGKRRPQYINQALVDITGFNHDEWLDGTAQAEINTNSPEKIESHWQDALSMLDDENHWQHETVLKRKDGTTFDALLVRTQVHNQQGERSGVVTILRDISESKRLSEQKARFIATAAHELRTPIANMKTRLYLMRYQPEKFDQHIEVAESVATLMQNLVEHMFDLTRFEHGIMTLEIETISLNSLLEEIIQYQTPEAERLGIALILAMPDESITLRADPHRLTQVITNLLSNALKYTKPNSDVTIYVTQAENILQIDIEDQGDGIEPEHIPYLFQPFYRISSTSKGAGLGLAIAHEIITAHGGTIDIHSTLGIGTKFSIQLPSIEANAESTPLTDQKIESS